MSKVHDRVLEVNFVFDESDDTVAVSSIQYYRDRAQLDAATGLALKIDTTAAQTSPAEIQFGEIVPPPTHLRLKFTAQA